MVKVGTVEIAENVLVAAVEVEGLGGEIAKPGYLVLFLGGVGDVIEERALDFAVDLVECLGG